MELATKEALLQAPDRAQGSDHIPDSNVRWRWGTGGAEERRRGGGERAKGGVRVGVRVRGVAATGGGVGGSRESRGGCPASHSENFSTIDLDSASERLEGYGRFLGAGF